MSELKIKILKIKIVLWWVRQGSEDLFIFERIDAKTSNFFDRNLPKVGRQSQKNMITF